MVHSQICDRKSGITRERVKGGAGTRPYPTDLSVLLGGRQSYRARVFFWGGVMSNPLYRAERYRDLAEEMRRLAAICSEIEIQNRYLRMVEHYSALAEVEEMSTVAYGP